MTSSSSRFFARVNRAVRLIQELRVRGYGVQDVNWST